MLNRVYKSKLAIAWYNAVFGVTLGNFAVVLPYLQDEIEVNNGVLGAILIAAVFGAVLALIAVTSFSHRYGSKFSLSVGMIILVCIGPILGINWKIDYFVVYMFFIGFALGWNDVSNNAQSVLSEKLARKPLLGLFQACYASGGLFGALIAGILLQQNISILIESSIIAGILILPSIAFIPWLFSFQEEKLITSQSYEWIKNPLLYKANDETANTYLWVDENSDGKGYNPIASKDADVIDKEEDLTNKTTESNQNSINSEAIDYLSLTQFCGICFIAYLGEGSIGDWSAIYLKDDLKSSTFESSLGYVVFQIFVAIGRISSDYIVQLIGRKKMLQFCGLISCFGLASVSLAKLCISNESDGSLSVILAIIGFGLTGIGLSAVAPSMISLAGSGLKGLQPNDSIAYVSLVGYLGILVGPPMLGGLSAILDGLQWSYMVDAALMLYMVVIATTLSPETLERNESQNKSDTSFSIQDFAVKKCTSIRPRFQIVTKNYATKKDNEKNNAKGEENKGIQINWKKLINFNRTNSSSIDGVKSTSTSNAKEIPVDSLFNKLKSFEWNQIIVGVFIGSIITGFSIFAPILLPIENELMLTNEGSTTTSSNILAPITLFQDILVDLQNDYVDDIDPAKLFKTGIKAMLKSLDPYSEFEDLKAAKSMQESVSGRYGGVGLVISNRKEATLPINTGKRSADDTIKLQQSNSKRKSSSNGVVVADAFEGYAYESGIRTGDLIISVNGNDCQEAGVEKVRDLLRGEPDTDVIIQYDRDEFGAPVGTKLSSAPAGSPVQSSKTQKQAKLTRRLVRISDIRLATLLGTPEDGIGYINLGGFNAGAGKDFRDAFLLLRYSAPEDLKGLILDLRGNPGGLLDMAVEIASYLVPEKSDIVSVKSKNGEEVVYRSAIRPIRPPHMKLAVLVNKGSASASEIVAGAIQDLDAGIIVGPTRTYGKGLVQKIVPLPYESALKYTIAKYYTPSGRCIQAIRYTGGRNKALVSVNTKPEDPTKKNENQKNKLNGPVINNEKSSSISIQSNPLLLSATTSEKGEEPSESKEETNPPAIEENSNEMEDAESMQSANDDDGAIDIPDKDKKTFYTIYSRRPVRDGGGIEPDYQTVSIKSGAAEGIFYSQGIYNDFASEYLKKHNVRPAIRKAAIKERFIRDRDPRFFSGSPGGWGNTANQYYVLNDDATNSLEKRRELFSDSVPVSKDEKKGTSASLQLNKETIIFDLSQSSYFDFQQQKGQHIMPEYITDQTEKSWWEKLATSNEFIKKGNMIGLSSQVLNSFFWFDSNHNQDKSDEIYREFRNYVTEQIKDETIDLESFIKPQLDGLEKSLVDLGLDSVSDVIKDLKPRVQEAILNDMDKNRKNIIDGLEMAVLSRELPDRLLVYHTVVQDPQVHAAFQLTSGNTLDVMPMKNEKSMVSMASTVSLTSSNSGAGKISDHSARAETKQKINYEDLLHTPQSLTNE